MATRRGANRVGKSVAHGGGGGMKVHDLPEEPTGVVDVNSKEYAFAACLVCGMPRDIAYKWLYATKEVKNSTLKEGSSRVLNTTEVEEGLSYLEKQLRKKYEKVKYRKADMDKLRDKEKLILEINDDLSAELETANKIKLRQQLIDLEQMKKVDVEEEIARPVLYLPVREGARGTVKVGGDEYEVVRKEELDRLREESGS